MFLKVQGQSLKESTHENAINILRQTPSKVRLLMYRDTNLKKSMLDPNHIYHIFRVELSKKPGKGLGVSIVGRKNEPGVFISEVVQSFCIHICQLQLTVCIGLLTFELYC